MKTLVALFTIAMLATASAQQPPPLPKTINLYNKATKEPIGTATFSGDRVYYRDKDGKHVSTGVINADGTHSFFDADGKAITENKKPGQ